MEFSFSINPLFGSRISYVDRHLKPARNYGPQMVQKFQEQMMQVIDQMGDRSAKAQGLYGPITSGKRLQLSDHHLYILKDENTPSGVGEMIGFIKTGRKRLFVYDRVGQQHEVEPLCVLDFYVHESRQRKGFGKMLFEHMLQHENVQKPQHMAIDRPSHKFLSFLSKHYGMKSPISQINNFALFDGFFRNRPAEEEEMTAPWDRPRHRPPRHPSRASSASSQARVVIERVGGGQRSRPSSGRKTNGVTPVDVIEQKHSVSALPLGRTSRNASPSPAPSGRRSRGGESAHSAPQPAYNRHKVDLFPQDDRRLGKETPPLRSRDGPRPDEIGTLNLHQKVQDSKGRLISRQRSVETLPAIRQNGTTTPNGSLPPVPDNQGRLGHVEPPNNFPWARAERPIIKDTGWNIMGIPSSLNGPEFGRALRQPQSTKFWWQ